MINLARFGTTATNTYFETERFAYFFMFRVGNFHIKSGLTGLRMYTISLCIVI